MATLVAMLNLQLLGVHINISVIWIIILCFNIYQVSLNLFQYSERYFHNYNGKLVGYQKYRYWVQGFIAISWRFVQTLLAILDLQLLGAPIIISVI
jgi:hypothetical protein